jgi:Rrf2 family protein
MPKVVNFSNSVTIGIHTLIVLAREKKPINAIVLAKKIGSSKHLVGKVLQRLVKDGLLTSSRGPTGGFLINRAPSEIQIYDIYKSIEGEVDYSGCPHEDQICPTNMCIRDNIINKMTLEFVNYLKENTIADYL